MNANGPDVYRGRRVLGVVKRMDGVRRVSRETGMRLSSVLCRPGDDLLSRDFVSQYHRR